MAATSKAATGFGPRLSGDPLSAPARVAESRLSHLAPETPQIRTPTVPPGTSPWPRRPLEWGACLAKHPPSPGPEAARRRHGNAAPQAVELPHNRVRVWVRGWWPRDTWALVRACLETLGRFSPRVSLWAFFPPAALPLFLENCWWFSVCPSVTPPEPTPSPPPRTP